MSTLTRYEGWILVGLLTVAVVYACWRGGYKYQETEGHLVFFGLMAVFGIGLWLLWNRVIFGDALYFLHSQYGAKAINNIQLLAMAPSHRPTGNLQLSATVVGWTILDNIGWVGAAIALLGLARLALTGRSAPAAVATLLLLFPIAFSVIAVYTGIEVLANAHATPGEPPTNARYGLLLAPAAGFLAGVLAQGRWTRWPVLAGCLASALLIWHGGLINVSDARIDATQYRDPARPAGEWLHAHYDDGLVLTQRRTSYKLLFTSRIPIDRVVYEGDRSEWSSDLSDPAREIRWIVMNAGSSSQSIPPDDVWRLLHDTPQLLRRYQLVYEDGPIQVYRVKNS